MPPRSLTVYTFTRLREQDIAIIGGERYEVAHLAAWQNGVISHFKAIVQIMLPANAVPR